VIQVGITDDYLGTHIGFAHEGESPSGKTKLWRVFALDGSILGQIRWFSRWRKYCFYANGNTIFEETCLTEIAEFIAARTKDHRGK